MLGKKLWLKESWNWPKMKMADINREGVKECSIVRVRARGEG